MLDVGGNARMTSIDIDFSIDPSAASATLASLQNSVKSSFDSINDSLKGDGAVDEAFV
jgi:hypothetical protein